MTTTRNTAHMNNGRTHRNWVSAGAVTAIATLTFAACGSTSSNAAGSSSSATNGSSSSTASSNTSGSGSSTSGQTLTYWASVEGTGVQQTTQTLGSEFSGFTKKTGIHVNLQVIPWSDLLQKILTAVTSGTGPDVMEIGNTWSPSFAASGGFLSFTPSVFKQIGGSSKFAASALKVSGAPGKAPISVPVYSEAYGLFYNKADFKAAGLSGPPKTWSQLVADGKKLTTAGRYGIAIEGASTSEAAHWAFLLGEQYGNPLYKNGKWDFATSKEAKAISKYINMVGSEHIANPSDAQSNSNISETEFAKNKAAMLVWQNPMSTLAQLGMNSSSYGATSIPTPSTLPSGGKAIQTFPAGINLAIPSSTKHKAAALELVKYLTSPTVQTKINSTYGTFPPVLAAQKTSAFQTPTEKALEGAYNNHAAPLPQVPSESTMETDLGGAITKLIAKAATGGSVSTSQILASLKSAQDQLDAAAGAS